VTGGDALSCTWTRLTPPHRLSLETRVAPGSTVDDVSVGIGRPRTRATSTVDHVRASVPQQAIASAAAHQRVGARPSPKEVVPGTGVEQRVHPGTPDEDIGSRIPSSRGHEVVPSAPHFDVVPADAEEAVFPGSPRESVVACEPDQFVVPVATAEHVVPLLTSDHVVATSSDDHVRTGTALDPIVPIGAHDRGRASPARRDGGVLGGGCLVGTYPERCGRNDEGRNPGEHRNDERRAHPGRQRR
jgi:hypothetical protein